MHGTTDYGDCVEDEWLIVYLLRELTKTFSDLWVRVFDTDGEFLLVEAANVLPKWLNPEIDCNRVWIHGGKLRIIPIEDDTPPSKKSLSLPDAIKVLESNPDSPIYSTFIEAEAFYRLEKYPSQIADSLHHSRVTIPRKLAYILHGRPKSIAPATEAFYLRDPLSLRPLMSDSPSLVFPPTDLVTVSVCFTKVLFAQLRSQRFDPPPSWASLIKSAEAEVTNESEGSREKSSQLEMGLKVTCGFEMLAKKASTSDNRVTREVGLVLDDLEEDGDAVLPTDADISAWKDVNREDDDSWMDIDYEDFERELEGKRSGDTRRKDAKPAFGDANTQADLRKIVSRFETFLNDDQAGIEGAEVEEMDHDDDEDDDDDELESDEEDSEGEDREVSFDEEQFANMMREMMGLPSGPAQRGKGKGDGKATETKSRVAIDSDDSDIELEEKEIKELMAQMESELNQHGALDLDPKPKKPAAIDNKASRAKRDAKAGQKTAAGEEEEEEASGDEEIDLDYNLAKNLLESFKSQAGMAGPAGNILSMMGMQLPRDEEDDEDEHKGS